MSYRLELDNGEKFDFSTFDQLIDWMADNNTIFEADAISNGLDKTINLKGEVAVYNTVEGFSKDGIIRRA